MKYMQLKYIGHVGYNRDLQCISLLAQVLSVQPGIVTTHPISKGSVKKMNIHLHTFSPSQLCEHVSLKKMLTFRHIIYVVLSHRVRCLIFFHETIHNRLLAADRKFQIPCNLNNRHLLSSSVFYLRNYRSFQAVST